MGFQETLINTATVIGPLFCSFAATFSHVIPFYASGALLLVGTFMALNLSALTKSDAEESVKKVSHKPLKTE
jgi:xanthine/uracil/vitamin C permease (AzgA family)